MVDETEIDRRALLSFLDATSDPPKVVWNPVCNWKFPDVMEDLTKYSGVTCEPRPRVLTHDEKTGELLLPELLPRAVKLDASKCKIKGAVPPGWFDVTEGLGPSLAALTTLYLNENNLEGNDHPDFAQLRNLTTLDLSENTFRGDLHALRLPRTLKVLNLDYNYFKGPVDPSFFEGLPNVVSLRLSGNKLKCEVPRRCWHFMPRLEELHLAKCLLEGPAPQTLADARELRLLDLSGNDDLDGELPQSLSELRWLEVRRAPPPRRNRGTWDSHGALQLAVVGLFS